MDRMQALDRIDNAKNAAESVVRMLRTPAFAIPFLGLTDHRSLSPGAPLAAYVAQAVAALDAIDRDALLSNAWRFPEPAAARADSHACQ